VGIARTKVTNPSQKTLVTRRGVDSALGNHGKTRALVKLTGATVMAFISVQVQSKKNSPNFLICKQPPPSFCLARGRALGRQFKVKSKLRRMSPFPAERGGEVDVGEKDCNIVICAVVPCRSCCRLNRTSIAPAPALALL
jgi:hypothetical protein